MANAASPQLMRDARENPCLQEMLEWIHSNDEDIRSEDILANYPGCTGRSICNARYI